MIIIVNLLLLFVICIAVLLLIVPWTIMTAAVFLILLFFPYMFNDKQDSSQMKPSGVMKTTSLKAIRRSTGPGTPVHG